MPILIYGLINSLILLITALGFSLVYGISRIPNFAHGAVYILTGYIVWTLFRLLHVNYMVAIVVALVVVSLIGAAIYKFLLRRVRGMALSEIIVSLAIGMILMEGLHAAGFTTMGYTNPSFVRGTVSIVGVTVDYQRVIIVVGGAALLLCIWAFTHYTKAGLALRGIAQDERAAMMLGIDSNLAATMSLAIGSALAGLAAVIILPLSSLFVETGYDALTLAIAVCILGGLGSWPGTIAGAFLLGYAEMIPIALGVPHYQIVVFLFAIILVLILRPSGLVGKQRELEERV